MNKNTKNNISHFFEGLVAADAAHFYDCLDAIVNKMIEHPAMLEEGKAGDATECFNTVLKGGFFSGNAKDARRTRCVAEVLYKFSITVHPTKSNLNKHPVGWKALNKDARGWCLDMLTREIPAGLSVPALNDILTAKWLVTKIMRDGGLFPTPAAVVSPQRDPLHMTTPEDMLDRPIDE